MTKLPLTVASPYLQLKSLYFWILNRGFCSIVFKIVHNTKQKPLNKGIEEGENMTAMIILAL